jgi:raffinose/stachyose/melibiose transport system permease protein
MLLLTVWLRPQLFVLLDNLAQAVAARDCVMIIAFIDSLVLTVVRVATRVVLAR